MFSAVHFIWLGISIISIILLTIFINKKKLSLIQVLNGCCIFCVISELTKLLSLIQIVPSSDGTQFYPYFPMNQMPLHLCSIQIIFIFYVRFTKNEERRNALFGIMYPACLLGATSALLLPGIFPNTVKLEEAFINPVAYQFFFYHVMLIVLSLYIVRSNEVKLERKHFKTALISLYSLAIGSLYINSMLASPVYENGVLKSVEFAPNFFFTFQTPIGLALTEKWQWLLYLLILTSVSITLVRIVYIPIFRRSKD